MVLCYSILLLSCGVCVNCVYESRVYAVSERCVCCVRSVKMCVVECWCMVSGLMMRAGEECLWKLVNVICHVSRIKLWPSCVG